MAEPPEVLSKSETGIAFRMSERSYLYVDGQRITSSEMTLYMPTGEAYPDLETRRLLASSAIANTETEMAKKRHDELFEAKGSIGTLSLVGSIGVGAGILAESDLWKASGSAVALGSVFAIYVSIRGYKASKRNESPALQALSERLTKLRGFLGSLANSETQAEQPQS